jgi:hypothetical protein
MIIVVQFLKKFLALNGIPRLIAMFIRTVAGAGPEPDEFYKHLATPLL